MGYHRALLSTVYNKTVGLGLCGARDLEIRKYNHDILHVIHIHWFRFTKPKPSPRSIKYTCCTNHHYTKIVFYCHYFIVYYHWSEENSHTSTKSIKRQLNNIKIGFFLPNSHLISIFLHVAAYRKACGPSIQRIYNMKLGRREQSINVYMFFPTTVELRHAWHFHCQ